MIETIIKKVKLFLRKLEVSKINYLNHKFKKYIIKYEEDKDNIKIYNSCGDYKIVKNTVHNKVKIMEIIKDHENEINERIEDYNNNKEDYKIIIISSALLLFALGCTFVFSFFVGSYILFFLTLFSFIIMLIMFSLNTYNTFINREEIKRLENIKNNKIILDDKELKSVFKDSFIYLKNYFYEIILKIIDLIDDIKVKF